MYIVIWVQGLFKIGYAKKIDSLTLFTKKVPVNSQALQGILICDKIIFDMGTSSE